MNILEMKDVNYIRQERGIVNDLSWTIQQGQHWALLGANGSGKTTLLKLITAYEWASNGHISVLGKVYGKCHVGLHRKHIGWVSVSLQRQLPAKDPAIRIVASGLEASFGWYGEWDEEIEQKALTAMQQLNIEHLSKQPYGILSQGEQKRVQIARAIIHKPQLLILDEPCEGLDPVSRHHFQNDLANYVKSENAPSIVYVTHHIEEIGDWITHGHVLKDGYSHTQDEIQEILTSEVLTEAFQYDCKVENNSGEFRINLK